MKNPGRVQKKTTPMAVARLQNQAADSIRATEHIAIAELRPHPRNYRLHPDAQLVHIQQSLSTHGFYRNIVIAQDGTILAGHGVVQAATTMGFTTVPVIRLPLAPNSPQALKVLAGDNEMSRLAEVDDRRLISILTEIQASESDLDVDALLGTGFDTTLLTGLLDGLGLSATTPTDTPGMSISSPEPNPPAEFPAYDENIPTQYCCPKCKYTWSGKAC